MADIRRNAMMLGIGFGTLGTLLWFSSPADLPWNYIVLALIFPLILNFYRQHVELGNFAVVAHTAVVLVFAIYCQYILSMLDRLGPEPAFHFSALSYDRLRIATAMNYLVLAVGLVIIASQHGLERSTAAFEVTHIRSMLSQHLNDRSIIFTGLLALLGAGAIFVVAPNVIDYPYPLQARRPWYPTAMFFNTLLSATLVGLISAYLKAPNYSITRLVLLSRLALYSAVTVTLVVAGGRGGVVSIFIVVVFIDYLLARRTADRVTVVFLVFDVILMIFMFFNWPIIRGHLHFEGWSAIPASFAVYSDLISGIIGEGRARIIIGEAPMVGQSLFHWIYAVRLVEVGSSRELATFFNLIPQAMPEIFDGLLWSRPPPDAIVLRNYFRHGGGLFIYANAYWNGGAAVTLAFAAVLFWLFTRIDIFFKDKDPIYLLSYFIFLVLIPVNTFYGIQPMARALQFGMIAYFLLTALQSGRRKQR